MSIDRNLIFGVLALRNRYIAHDQFVEVNRAWAADKTRGVGDLLVGRGLIDEGARGEVERLVDIELGRCDGDPRRTLAAVADPETVDLVLREVHDSEIRATFSTIGGFD